MEEGGKCEVQVWHGEKTDWGGGGNQEKGYRIGKQLLRKDGNTSQLSEYYVTMYDIRGQCSPGVRDIQVHKILNKSHFCHTWRWGILKEGNVYGVPARRTYRRAR